MEAAKSDIKFNNSIEIESRSVALYDKLNIFLKGMLGETLVAHDVLKSDRDANDVRHIFHFLIHFKFEVGLNYDIFLV